MPLFVKADEVQVCNYYARNLQKNVFRAAMITSDLPFQTARKVALIKSAVMATGSNLLGGRSRSLASTFIGGETETLMGRCLGRVRSRFQVARS